MKAVDAERAPASASRAAVLRAGTSQKLTVMKSVNPTPVPIVLNSTSPMLGSRPGRPNCPSSTRPERSAPTASDVLSLQRSSPSPMPNGTNRRTLLTMSARGRSPQTMQPNGTEGAPGLGVSVARRIPAMAAARTNTPEVPVRLITGLRRCVAPPQQGV
jgi:hypothetical protein